MVEQEYTLVSNGGKMMHLTLTFLMLFGTWACGSQPIQKDKAGAPIPGLNLSGDWFSPEFGTMIVKQDGIAISGEYEDRFSRDRNGHFKGIIKGDVLRLTWIQPGNPKAAIMPKKGMAWLRVKKRGLALEGEFGYDKSHDNGGRWSATKATEEQGR
jgi:hypothetical protein